MSAPARALAERIARQTGINCQSNGVCAKPCVILTTFCVSGCWVELGVTCCGSDCRNDPGVCP